MDKIGIGLLGYGTVGSGVGKLLKQNADDITLATGKQVVLKRVLEKDPAFSHPDLDPALVTTRFE
ncbi:MAG: homoserine dehydrogenase, partial [Deltaproteobacteria bacterium]